MSDGITDSYRDQRRAEDYEYFLDCLVGYLEKQIGENLVAVKKAAAATDAVPRGLMSGRTNLSDGLDGLLEKLLEKDERMRGKLLFSAHNIYPPTAFEKLKGLSPFKNRLLVWVDYGIGFVNLRGELQGLIDKAIARGRNMKIYDADKYLLTLPESVLNRTEVIWLDCGYLGIKEPRKAR
jgi:hypothetical protein